MAADTVAPVASIPGTRVAEDRLPIKTLNQQDFLRLLVAQMTQQVPLNPKLDMKSFTELEQSRSMQNDIAQLRAQQQWLQANSLLGRTVEIHDGISTQLGQVTAVQMEEGTPELVVNGSAYDLSSVLSIKPTVTGN